MTKFDLKDRILKFVMSVIDLTKKLPENRTNNVIITQIIRSATSIGANFEEADRARSKKEFISIMGISKKETKETKYWLKVIRLSNDKKYHKIIDPIGQESEELIKIISAIIINSSKK